jgi:hypothetical protein
MGVNPKKDRWKLFGFFFLGTVIAATLLVIGNAALS